MLNIFFLFLILGKLNSSTTFRVGVILDMASCVGQISWKSFSISKNDFYATYPNYTTRLVLVNKDSKDDVLGAASAGNPSLAFFSLLILGVLLLLLLLMLVVLFGLSRYSNMLIMNSKFKKL
ncbi:Glutamate receptor 2.2 [Acorus gramineus]|uniref:Glutamate receptor 2.2 n=1 Tax=Acorus gramineus TaxID=55184 RepID=A0AAV9BL98_ACOGR|nr:Glutamate receptor 2.2 [Acorus gramineus]